jgi:hypothetical protein
LISIAKVSDFQLPSGQKSASMRDCERNRPINRGSLTHFREISCRGNATIRKRNLQKGRIDFRRFPFGAEPD